MKTADSYPLLVRGVSQQEPEQRHPGQVTEQVNMLADAVKGLTRRWGSIMQSELQTTLDPELMSAYSDDTANYRTFEYTNNGSDFVVLYRAAFRPAESDLPVVMVFDKTNGNFLEVVRNDDDAELDILESDGISAITAIGKYVFMAGHSTVPAAESDDVWGSEDNQLNAVLWVRGGAYARTFKVTVTLDDDSQETFEYTTPTSSYPGVLDTSAVPLFSRDAAGGTSSDSESAFIVQDGSDYKAELTWYSWSPTSLAIKKDGTDMTNVFPAAPANNLEFSWDTGDRYVLFHSSNLGAVDITMTYTHTKTVPNPGYTQAVTSLTNAFNSAVTNWIGTAAEAIQPQNIAEQLRLAAVAAGITTATREASTVIFDNVKGIVVNDGGDGSLLRGVANEVSNVDQVSDLHLVGKVVKVRARSADQGFYLKAQSKDPLVTSGYTEVTWVEAAGTVHTITNALSRLTVDSGVAYMASSATLLDDIVTGPAPDYAPSTAGDSDSSPLPFFVGKKITYLGVFQDRLLIGAGGVLRGSKVGDYLNFFRSSILTAPGDDPVETLSQGAEDDELRFSVLYDRDLVIFGKNRQYAISGRTAFTPTSPNMPVMSNHKDAAQIQPVAAGGLIFYGKQELQNSSIHQIQPGLVAESPESFPTSPQLNTYLAGRPIELQHHSQPSTLFLRTAGARNTVFVFQYLDTKPGERLQDAWGRWDFNPILGPVIGMASSNGGLLVFTLRSLNGNVYQVADLVPMSVETSNNPYLDSLRSYSDVQSAAGSIWSTTQSNSLIAAFNDLTERRFMGSRLRDVEDLIEEFPDDEGLMVGALQDSYIIPTNPFKKDSNGQAITTGRLTVTNFLVRYAQSSGFVATISPAVVNELSPAPTVLDHNGLLFGDAAAIIGQIPVTNAELQVPVGKETKDFTFKLAAQNWAPFNLKALSWTGQWFNRTQRFS